MKYDTMNEAALDLLDDPMMRAFRETLPGDLDPIRIGKVTELGYTLSGRQIDIVGGDPKSVLLSIQELLSASNDRPAPFSYVYDPQCKKGWVSSFSFEEFMQFAETVKPVEEEGSVEEMKAI